MRPSENASHGLYGNPLLIDIVCCVKTVRLSMRVVLRSSRYISKLNQATLKTLHIDSSVESSVIFLKQSLDRSMPSEPRTSQTSRKTEQNEVENSLFKNENITNFIQKFCYTILPNIGPCVGPKVRYQGRLS